MAAEYRARRQVLDGSSRPSRGRQLTLVRPNYIAAPDKIALDDIPAVPISWDLDAQSRVVVRDEVAIEDFEEGSLALLVVPHERPGKPALAAACHPDAAGNP